MNGKQLVAGTSSLGVYICLVGENGHSGKLYVQNFLSLFSGGTLHQDKLENVIIESSGDLGEISIVILGIDDSILHYSWYVNEVGIYNFQSQKKDAFPCYHWIGSGHSVSMITQTGKSLTLSLYHLR